MGGGHRLHLRLAGTLSLLLIWRYFVDSLLLELHLLVLLLLGKKLSLKVILLVGHDHALGLTLVRLGPLLYFGLSHGLLPEGCGVNQLTQVLVCRVDLCGQLLGSKGCGRAGLAAQLVVPIDLALG